MTAKDPASIIQSLAAESSTKIKTEILKTHQNNDLLKKIFDLTLNPFYNFFIKVNPESVSGVSNGSSILSIDLLTQIQDNLCLRKITGNAARDYIYSILIQLTSEHRNLLINIINRDLNCKVASGLVNRVWTNLIPEFPCMLAESYDAKTSAFIKEGQDAIIVQKKEDGGRVAIVVDANSNVSVYSRNGNLLETHDVFQNIFKNFPGNVFDGELLVIDTVGMQDRKASNGIFNKAVRSTITLEEAVKFHAVVWDMIPIEDWKAGFCDTPYSTRLRYLSNAMINVPPHRASIVQSKIVSYHYQVQKFYEEMLTNGFEGAIVKNANMPWENKRSKHMLKLKEVKDTSLLCTGVQAHSKNSAWIGSLECQSSDGKLKVSIGSGLTEADRMLPASHFIDKIIDVKYNMVITNKQNDEKSLFLPRYMGIRHDQTVADSIDKIK